jgi:hypothetical protein
LGGGLPSAAEADHAIENGLAFEDDRPRSLAEALAALEKGLRAWFAEKSIELDEGGR